MPPPPFSSRIRATFAAPIPTAKAWAARYDGRSGPTIDLTQAVPGYPTHPDLARRLAEGMASPAQAGYGTIDGDASLREVLAADINRVYGGDLGASDVAITAGANLAFTMAMTVLCGVGDQVMLPVPWYFNNAMALTMQGLEALPLPCRAADGFVPDPERAAALLTPRTRAIVLISPNNPTGAVYPPEVIARFAALCRERGIWLILDEVIATSCRRPLCRRISCFRTGSGGTGWSISTRSRSGTAWPGIGSAPSPVGFRFGPN